MDQIVPDDLPHRDDPGPDWIRYDDGRIRNIWISEDPYWSRVIFTPRNRFQLIGVRFIPFNPGPSEAPCWIKVYSEDNETHDLEELLWEIELEELRQWVGNGNNWHWVEIPEEDRPTFEGESSFSIIIGPAPAGMDLGNAQEGDGWWMSADLFSESSSSYNCDGEEPVREAGLWRGNPDFGDLLIRANGEFIGEDQNHLLRVPEDYETIQAAIDNASDGDTVLVNEGEYTENIDFGGKNILVASNFILDLDEAWMFFTIIDGNEEGAVVTFRNNETDEAQLIGFTITNGIGHDLGGTPSGGGIYCANASPILSHLQITQNTAGQGGGIFCETGEPTVTNCTFEENSGPGQSVGGGIICLNEGNARVSNCEFIENTTWVGGAVVCVQGSNATFNDCIFRGNATTNRGGVVYLQENPDVSFVNCEFTGNTSESHGGAFYSFAGSSPDIRECNFTGNETTLGGTIYLDDDCNAVITDCEFTNNSAETGGGIFTTSNPEIRNCVISDNEASEFGGGIICMSGSAPTLQNLTIDGNSARFSGGGVYFGDESQGIMVNCTFSSNSANNGGGLFIEGSTPDIIECELDSNRAIYGAGTCCLLEADAFFSGCSFTNGRVTETGGGMYVGNEASPRVIECEINGNNAEQGGGVAFIEEGEAEFTNCNITDNTGSFAAGGIFFMETTPTLISCTIEDNFGAGAGGGMFFNDNSSPEIIDCVISNNETEDRGGGLFLQEDAAPTFTGTSICENTGVNGGGIYMLGAGDMTFINCRIDDNTTSQFAAGASIWSSDPEFSNCTFIGNTTELAAAGLIISDCEPVFEDCLILNNVADNGDEDDYGGGIMIQSVASPEFDGCTISGNTADSGGGFYITGNSAPAFFYCCIHDNHAEVGGGLYCIEANPELIDCTVSDNDVTVGAGGIYGQGDSNPTLVDCIIWGNARQEIYFQREGDRNSVTISYSDIEGGRDRIVTNNNCTIDWGDGNIDEDPEFVEFNDIPFFLDSDSPCIDTGDPESPEDPDGTRADMGAFYHHQGPGIVAQPDTIIFRPIELGEQAERTFEITNFGDELLEVAAIEIESDHFSIDFEEEFDLDMHESREITVVFDPQERGEWEVDIVISSNDEQAEEIIVYVSGAGYTFNPPEVRNEIGNLQLEEDFEPFIVADLNEVFIDEDGDELSFTVSSDARDLITRIDNEGRLTLSATENWSGAGTITVTADDGVENPRRDDTVDEAFEVLVTPVNDLPTDFALLTPEHFEHTNQYPEVMFTWEESVDEVEDSTVTYTMNLSFGDNTLIYMGIESTFYTVHRTDLSVDPHEETTVIWRVYANDGTDSIRCERSFILTVEPLPVYESKFEILPTVLTLRQAYPNPFNDGTFVTFGIPKPTDAVIAVYDLAGRLVKTLEQGSFTPGWYRSYWNGTNTIGFAVPAGLYLCRMKASEKVMVNRLILLR